MRKFERIRVRPGYHSKDLLIEFCGDHRSEGFPNVSEILRKALCSEQVKHPNFDEVKIAMSQDRYFSYWAYANGTYEIDDDIWGLFVSTREDNDRVIGDIERSLMQSGLFVKEDVNFADYA